MGQYLNKGKELLKVLTKNGCEAYIIGEASRAEVMGTETKEVEIVTSATPGMVRGIFTNFKVEEISDTSSRITYDGFEFIIGTFRSNNASKGKRQAKEVYSKKLEDELSNRLVTADAIAMTSGGKFSDSYDGFKDIKRRKLVSIGNTVNKLRAVPRDAFKVIRMYADTGFKLDGKLSSGLKEASKKFATLEPSEYMSDLKKTLETKRYKKVYGLYKSLKVKKRLPVLGLELHRLAKVNKTESFDDFLINSMVLSGQVDSRLTSYLTNEPFDKNVISLAIISPKSKYDNVLLYNYGLDCAVKANLVNFNLGKAKRLTKLIERNYAQLPIKRPCELEFKAENLIELAQSNGEFVGEIMEEIIYKVITRQLPNERDALTSYASRALQERDILVAVAEVNLEKEVERVPTDHPAYDEVKPIRVPQEYYTKEKAQDLQPQVLPAAKAYKKPEVQEIQDAPNALKPQPKLDILSPSPAYVIGDTRNVTPNMPQINPVQQVQNDYESFKYQSLQRELAEVRKMIDEKDNRITTLQKAALVQKFHSEVERLVNQNIVSLDEVGYFNSENEKTLHKLEQKKLYQNMLLQKPHYAILTMEDINEKH